MIKPLEYCKECPYSKKEHKRYTNVCKSDILVISDTYAEGRTRQLLNRALDISNLKIKDISVITASRCPIDNK